MRRRIPDSGPSGGCRILPRRLHRCRRTSRRSPTPVRFHAPWRRRLIGKGSCNPDPIGCTGPWPWDPSRRGKRWHSDRRPWHMRCRPLCNLRIVGDSCRSLPNLGCIGRVDQSSPMKSLLPCNAGAQPGPIAGPVFDTIQPLPPCSTRGTHLVQENVAASWKRLPIHLNHGAACTSVDGRVVLLFRMALDLLAHLHLDRAGVRPILPDRACG